MHRRGVLRVGLTGALWLGLSGAARATLGRAASIDELVVRSRHVLVGEALDAYSTWEQIGARKHIVTYTRIKPSELLAGADLADPELLLRTLGGRVGDLGELVPGEAQLVPGQRSLLFAMQFGSSLAVTAMAQGHYPLARDRAGVERLERSPQAVEFKRDPHAAVERLHGLDLPSARSLVRAVAR
jgi:hypothetical protein